ncbi:4-aminobutyrate--2-oxoglutarate transaminase [Sciscionella marina]|uniref:4-aminobutyrate--2-oxoglutarate transaminase n=1 Tax=Sciscionella marina TaxID=508770 RepID=UPI00036BB72A|nr:4-aminobutyrate--2-oxoglutarate transaminase [Sciscionella marina]
MTNTANPGLRTGIPGPAAQRLGLRRERAVADGASSLLPVYTESGGDGVLIDVDGNAFIDLGSGIAVTSVGNPAPKVTEAIREQAGRFIHTCFMVSGYEGYVEVCEQLNELTPGAHDKRSVLSNSGAEAVENAVKIARHATGRSTVVVFDNAYHGRTNLTMALTAKNMPYKHRFGPFAPEIARVPMSYPYRDPHGMTGQQAAQRAIDRIRTQVGAENTAAVLLEPIQGEGGFIVPAPGFLPAIAEWCRDNGVLFIADEIQTGFCRTGSWFACEHENILPDLITTAKALAGGLPLAAVTGRAEIMNSVHRGGLGGTYSGNPIACAAALAAIDTMREQNLVAAAAAVEETTRPRLDALAQRDDGIGEVRGRGAMLALEFVHPGTGRPDPERTARIAAHCHRAGTIVLTCGTHDNVIRLLPPLTIPAQTLVEGLDTLEAAVAEC